MNISTRKIGKDDINIFYSLFEKLLKSEFSEYSENVIKWVLESPKGHNKNRTREGILDGSFVCFGGFVDNKIVGFAFGLPSWGGISTLHWLAIDPKYQRKGIGRRLVEEWEKNAKKEGAHSVHLGSSEWNLKFYEKLGYEVIGRNAKSYFGVEDYFLTKLIQEPKEENYLR